MAAVVTPVGAPPPVSITKVNLFLQCMHLPNLDVASKSDPQVTVTLSDARGTRVIGQTEIVADNLNPKFAKAIPLDYFFEEVQTLSFEIHDVDATSRDYIGQVTCTVGDIFGARGQELVRQIAVQKVKLLGKPPMMVIRGEEVKGVNANVNFRLSGSHLDKKDPGPFAKSDPYLLMYKELPDGTRTLVHRTNTILSTLNPTWQPFTLHMSVLCNGDAKMPIYIEVFDWDKHSDDDLIGVCRTSLEHLLTRPMIELINPKKQKKKASYKNSGVLNVLDLTVVNEYTFLEYLAGGTQLNLMVGIDYTASNGNPAQPGSLHFRDPSGALNQYGNAIVNVGNILMPYDYDGNVPVYGFGGRLPNGETSHCFALTGNPAAPEVPGVAGVMDVYAKSFQWVALHGPTNFAPLIKQACSIAAQYHAMAQDVAAYLLLLIITDGEITDMNATVDAIVEASALPMSIVIVGVGNADFSKMDILDADGKLLQGRNGTARRDIVQFVPYNKFKDPVRLAAATLAELPGQLVGYMKTFNIKPRARVVTDVMALANQVQSVTVTTTTGTAVNVPMPGGIAAPVHQAPLPPQQQNIAPMPSPGMISPVPGMAPAPGMSPAPGMAPPPANPYGAAPGYGQPQGQSPMNYGAYGAPPPSSA
jgi:hypothetical protein